MADLNLQTNQGGTSGQIYNPQQTQETQQTQTTQTVTAPATTQVPETSKDGTSTSTQVVVQVATNASTPVITPPPVPISASDQNQLNGFLNSAGWGTTAPTILTTPSIVAPDPTTAQVTLPPESQAAITAVATHTGKDPTVLQTQATQVIETVRQQILNDPSLPADAKQEILTLLITNSDLNGGPPPSTPLAKAKLDAARQEITNGLASLGINEDIKTDPFITPQSPQDLLNNQIPNSLSQSAGQISQQPQYGDDYTDPKVIQEANSDPQIVALAKAKGETPIQVYKEIQQTRQQVLDQVLSDPQMTESVKNEILNSLLGDSTVPLSPNAQKYLNDIKKQTNDALVKMGLPSGSNDAPLNGTAYQQGLQANAGQQFETSLKALGLSAADQKAILNAYYLPDDHNPLTTQQQKILDQLTNGNPPTTDSTYYEGVLNSAFQNAFLTALQNHVPPISAADQQIILNGYPSSIPARLESVVAELTTTATQKVQGDYGVPKTWTPSVTTIVPSTVNSATMNGLQNMLNTANEMVAEHMKIAEAMPNGPDKTSYINFLKQISDCLQIAQNCMYSIEAASSNCAHLLQQLMNSIQQAQLDLTKISDAAIKKKEHHRSHMPAWLDHLTRAITDACILIAAALVCVAAGIVSVASFGAAAPAAACMCAFVVAVAVAYVAQDIASQATNQKTTYLQQGMAAMNNDIENAMPANMKEMGFVLAMICDLVVVVCAGWQNPMLAFSMISDSGFCQTFGKACYPNDPQKAMWASMAMETTVMIVGMVCCGKFGNQLKAVQGLQKMAGLGEAAEGLSETAKAAKIASLNMKINTALILVGTISAGMSIGKGVVDVQNAQIDIDVAKLRKKLEMSQADLDAMVTVLKKVIQSLIDLVNAQGDNLVQLANIQNNLRTGASDVMTQLARAGAA